MTSRVIVSEAEFDESSKHCWPYSIDLRIPVAMGKVARITLLLIEMDLEQMALRLPEDKLKAMKTMMQNGKGRS